MQEKILEQFYENYAKELTIYAYSLTKQMSEAESLVSDAFFQLSCQEKPPPAIKFWLFRVVKNHFIDQQRKKKRWRWVPFSSQQSDEKPNPSEQLLQKESQQQLHQAIAQLKAPYQEVLILFYFIDWPVQVIAEYLNYSNGQVRTILYRGRKKLKEVLSDEK
ncbi:MAG: RNA polymerase sigma factor [Enterococcus lemanii]